MPAGRKLMNGVSDGSRLMAVRYSSEGESRTLYHSNSIAAVLAVDGELELLPFNPRLS